LPPWRLVRLRPLRRLLFLPAEFAILVAAYLLLF